MKALFVVNAAPSELASGAIQLASVRYRAAMPAVELRQSGWQADVVALDAVLRPDFQSDADVIVLAQPKENRLLQPDLLPGLGAFIQRHRAAGARLLVDVCDLKVGAPYVAYITQMLKQAAAGEVCRQFYPGLLRAADGIVVPTQALADRIADYLGQGLTFSVIGDPVEVAPAPVRFAPDPVGLLRLLWFGFFGVHAGAVAGFCLRDLPRLTAKRPVTLTLLCEAQVERLLPKLRADSGGAEIAYIPWSVPALETALAAADAVVFPIDHGSDSAVGKSNNRALQALQAGRAIFAQPIASYRELDAYGVIAEDLVPGIEAALVDPEACRARTALGQAYVAAHYAPAAIARLWADVLKR